MKRVNINSKEGEALLQAYVIVNWDTPKVKVRDHQDAFNNAKRAAKLFNMYYTNDKQLTYAFEQAYLHVKNMQTSDYDQWHRLKEALQIQVDINQKGVEILQTVPDLLGGITSFDAKRIWNAVKKIPQMMKDGLNLESQALQHAGQTLRGEDEVRDADNAEAVRQAEPKASETVKPFEQAKREQQKAQISELKDARDRNDERELINLKKQYIKKNKLGNHPEWYGRYPEILPNALNFGVRKEAQGFDMAIGARISTTLVIPQKDGAVSQAYKDALRAIFIKLRGSNNGAFNYDDDDVAAYIEVARGIYAYYYMLHRDLKLINNLDPYVSKTPEPILALAGYSGASYTDLRDNRANHIIRLNQIAHKIEITLPIPPDMSVFERDRYVATSVVEEGKGPKSSLFVYTLAKVLTPDSNKDLDQWMIGGTMTSRINDLETLIDNIYNYTNPTYGPQTLVKIAGDMIKAYGEKAFKTLPLNTEADKCSVIRDEYLLNQIQNNNMIQYNGNGVSLVTAAPAYTVAYNYDYSINGTDGAVAISKEDLRGVAGNPDSTFIINRNSGNISNLECISLTRGNFVVEDITNPVTGSTYTKTITDCGTDIIDEFRYFYYEEGTNSIKNIVFNSDTRFVPLAATLWGQVDYSPLLTAYPVANKAYIMLDLDTYAYCSLAQFRAMNDAAVLSEYKTVPINSQVNFKTARK